MAHDDACGERRPEQVEGAGQGPRVGGQAGGPMGPRSTLRLGGRRDKEQRQLLCAATEVDRRPTTAQLAYRAEECQEPEGHVEARGGRRVEAPRPWDLVDCWCVRPPAERPFKGIEKYLGNITPAHDLR
ncbi:hypothetical protein NDU88_004830 [Pleurodeles waltl]|uniref:Uncharacterized protein n=1 Tax=Pleurodeles waltl TaxID=8319 RepID=A0AAV7NM47_PLEWA|nr:hypothetical protein NDU88_004830 [Pleurodeles waltl]